MWLTAIAFRTDSLLKLWIKPYLSSTDRTNITSNELSPDALIELKVNLNDILYLSTQRGSRVNPCKLFGKEIAFGFHSQIAHWSGKMTEGQTQMNSHPSHSAHPFTPSSYPWGIWVVGMTLTKDVHTGQTWDSQPLSKNQAFCKSRNCNSNVKTHLKIPLALKKVGHSSTQTFDCP
jgi:hypothetical protein